jgi:hypothetical protein
MEGIILWAVSKSDGKKLAAYDLSSSPVWDGMPLEEEGCIFQTCPANSSAWKAVNN